MKYPKSIVCIASVFCFMISCGVKHPLYTAPNTMQMDASKLYALPSVPLKTKHDTVKLELTERQKLFYDKYFLPQFESLRGVVTKQSASIQLQANSIKQLSDIISNMRMRSIRRNDSMQNVFAIERGERGKLEKIYLDEQRKQVARNAQQITSLNDIANALIAATIIMILCILGLIAIAVSLWKKVRILDKKVSHA